MGFGAVVLFARDGNIGSNPPPDSSAVVALALVEPPVDGIGVVDDRVGELDLASPCRSLLDGFVKHGEDVGGQDVSSDGAEGRGRRAAFGFFDEILDGKESLVVGFVARVQNAVVLRLLFVHGHSGEQRCAGSVELAVELEHAFDARRLVEQELVGRRDDEGFFLCQPVSCAPHGVSKPEAL